MVRAVLLGWAALTLLGWWWVWQWQPSAIALAALLAAGAIAHGLVLAGCAWHASAKMPLPRGAGTALVLLGIAALAWVALGSY